MSLIKIISEEKINNLNKEFFSNDDGLITLIVGWELAKSTGASILNHQIDEKTYWTFSLREKRKIFEEDLKKYELLVLNHLKKDKTITNLNPLNFLNSEQFLSYLLNNFYNLNAYLYKESFYFYDINKIYHIDIRLLGFMSWDIIDEIKDIFKIKIIKKEDLTYLKYLDFKYIPYLIDAKENTIISNIPR
jgi:hypothetical protein